MSLQSYQSLQNATESPRQTEYRLMAMVTRELMDSQGSNGPEFYKAVDRNRRLWLTLQIDLASEENMLPDELKAKLISLSIWVDKHSAAVLRGQKEIEPLVDVNRSIMEGLVAGSTG